MNRVLSKYCFYYPVTFFKGELVNKYLRKYNQNQFLSIHQIEILQLSFLKPLLLHAYKHCSFYNKLYNQLDIDINLNSLDELKNIPMITKNDIIDHQSTISSGMGKLRVSSKTTGGSSGHPVTILKNVSALARERAATWRSYAWAGVQVGDPQARFWGVPLRMKNQLKYKVIDFIANRIRLSAFDITHTTMKDYYRRLHGFRPVYLYGYVSMIDIFAQYLNEEGLELPDSVVSIITTSEILTDQIKKRIECKLHRRVFNEYGCGEVGSIAHECSCGSMHIMADNLIVEIDDSGEVIVTDLHNYAMPLIRYRLNDFAELSTKQCSCGCQFPVLEKIYGRAYDLIQLKNGRRSHPELIIYVFEEFKEKFRGLCQFQFVQHGLGDVSINLVVNDKFKKSVSEQHLRDRFECVLGMKPTIVFYYKDEIEREKSGKIRLVKCEIE